MTTYDEGPTMSVVRSSRYYPPENGIMREDDDLLLIEVYEKFLAKNKPECGTKVPFIVKLLENPKSPVHLTGAVSVLHHDILRCIVGRGIEEYDEAFVVGMTMGSVKTLQDYEIKLYKFVSRHLFPGAYKISQDNLCYFDLGITMARTMPDIKPLNAFDPEDMFHKTMKEIRSELGIEMAKINQVIFPERGPDGLVLQ